ncbi:MAG: hypothetical protein ABR520_08660 [Mycobacteriales bacterium]|nr:hypothetical protein [Frankia sp.]
MTRMPRLAVGVLATVTAATFGAARVAHAACAGTTKSVSGTVAGTDGRYVNIFIGFDIYNSANQQIGLDGCVRTAGGYGVTQWLNRSISSDGATTNPGGLTKSWRQTLPANAHHVYIENYPKNSSGTTVETRYGHSLRRNLAVPRTGVNLRLPVICPAGGSTGGIHGYVSRNGTRVQASRAVAWSIAADSNTMILGWNIGTTASTGYYKVPNLASNQQYVVWVTYNGVTQKKKYIPVYPPTTSPRTCRMTPLNFAF